MSILLGPIHNWLYKKIIFQDDLVNEILSSYDDGAIKDKLAEKYGELEREPLENIIDGSNIHGWLQQRVSLVENRFADIVTSLLSEGRATVSNMEKLAFSFGKESRPQALTSPGKCYACLNDTLLDGMPCDRINEIITETDNEVCWRRIQCVHKPYWDSVGGNIDNYYIIRDALIEGMMDGSGFTYEKTEDNTFKLKRRP